MWAFAAGWYDVPDVYLAIADASAGRLDEFDERRFGGRFSLGRRFSSLWSGSLNSRIESVEISNILPDSPVDIFELEGEDNAIIGVGPRFVRNTLDNQFLPTRGSRTEFGVEQVFGDFDFTRFEAQHSVFIPLARDDLDRATVLELSTSVGYIPQGEDEAPVFERFYLGGNSFRGFEFRTISPRSVRADNGEPSDDPVGGTWQFFAGLQLRQPIFQNIVSAVAFIDTGTVTNDPGFEDYRVSVGAGLRISIPQLSPAPLAFDFGFPLLDEETDESQLFSFSIDLPF
ncbi:MAG: outer membrane protein assembly factor, partial [Planctomycetota bacterium]